MVNAADLTDDMDNRLADLEVRLYAVMLEQDDIGILLCNDVREMLECARCIRHEHRELQLTAAGNQALFHNLVNKGYVDIAAGQHAYDLFAAYIHLVVEHSRERSRTRGLNDLLAALEQQQNSGSNLVIGNRDNAVHILLDILKGLFARGLYGDTVSDGVHGIGRSALTGAERICDRRCALSLYADDLDARVDLLCAGSHAGDQSAAAGRNEDHVNARQVAQDFQCDGALTRHNILIVKRVDELCAGLLADLACLGIGFIVNIARQNNLGTVALGCGNLCNRRGTRHNDGGLYTGSGCRKGNALCMVARRGRNNSVQVALSEALHNLIVSTAHLKGAGLLLIFVLQINLCAGHGGEGAGRRQRNVVDDVFQSVRSCLEIF